MTTSVEQGQISYKESAAKVVDALGRHNPALAARLKDAIFHLAREYERASGTAPTADQLNDEIIRRYDPTTMRLNLEFAQAAARFISYPDVYKYLSPEKPHRDSVLDYVTGHHDTTLGLTAAHTAYLSKDISDEDLMKKLLPAISNGLLDNIEGFLTELNRHKDKPLRIGPNKVLLLLQDYAAFCGQYAIAETLRTYLPDFLKIPALQGRNYKADEYRTYKELRRAHPELSPREITGLELIFHDKIPAQFNMSVYLHNRGNCAYEYQNIRQLNIISAMTALLMPDHNSLMKFTQNWGQRLKVPSRHPLTMCLQHVKAQAYNPQIDYKSWGEGLKQYGPRFGFYFDYAGQLPTPEVDKQGRPSIYLTREALMPHSYKEASSDPELARFCFRHQIAEKDFNTAAELLRRYNEPDSEPDRIPDIELSGTHFGLPGTTFRRLAYDDPRLLFAGTFTGCCEHIGSTCDDSIIHAVSTRKSAIYAIVDDKTTNVLAHSWVWVSPNDYLVFDGFETASPRINNPMLLKAVQLYAATLAEQSAAAQRPLSVVAVTIGRNGTNIETPFELPQIDMGEIIHLTAYRDIPEGDRQLLTKKDRAHLGDSQEFRLIRSFVPTSQPLLLTDATPRSTGQALQIK